MRNDKQIILFTLKLENNGFHAHCEVVIRLLAVSDIKKKWSAMLPQLLGIDGGMDQPRALQPRLESLVEF